MRILKIFLSLLTSSFIYCDLIDHLKPAENKIAVQSIPNIDYIYIINLDHREEKLQDTLEQLSPYHIVPYRFSAVNGWKLSLETIHDLALKFEKGMRPGAMGTVYRYDHGKEFHSHEIIEEEGVPYFVNCMTRGGIGCILSHLSVIHDALNSGYEVVWICEDDIEVVRDPRILSQYIDDLDQIVGRDHWDVLFTFRDYRGPDGHYLVPYGANHRPNIETRFQEQFNIDKPISKDLRQVGTRFGTQSMIWSRQGMEKLLKFYKEYKVFIPYDLDLVLIPGIKMYSVLEDVVVNKLDSITDLGRTIVN